VNTLYLDLSAGISGDMFVGALIDLGVQPAALERELGKLGVAGYHLHARRSVKGAIAGVKFDVHLEADHHVHGGHGHDHEPPHAAPAHHHHGEDEDLHRDHAHPHEHDEGHGHAHSHDHGGHTHDHPHDHAHGHEHDHDHGGHRGFAEIRRLIQASALSEWVKEQAIAVFGRLAEAEGRVHGVPAEQVTFHEVGAVDSIVDIVGACIGLEMLGKPRVLAGPVVEGTGWVRCAHGRLPLPAPATLGLFASRGVPLSQCDEPHEMVTPTGAALLVALAGGFGPMSNLAPRRIGYGLGTRDHRSRPNVLRAVLGEMTAAPAATPAPAHDWETDTVTVLETNLDDINPEILGWVSQRALAAGALDCFHTPIQMKKGRPAALLTVLCEPAQADSLTELLLRETTAFGVRRHAAERRKLQREFVTAATPHGPVTVKLGRLDGRVVQASPEFESCRAAAEQAGVPLRSVYEAALAALPR